MSRLFIVRHGNTFAPGEPPRRIGARTDLPLTESGVVQAHALGAWFATSDIRFTSAFSGPLRRTTQTARIVLAHAGDPPLLQTAAWLTEVDHGPDEDQLEELVIARLGAFALQAWDQNGVAPAGWSVDASGRIAAWNAFFTRNLSGDTLVVTSNGSARFALLAGALTRPGQPLKLSTGAYGVIKLDARGPHLTAWNVRPGA